MTSYGEVEFEKRFEVLYNLSEISNNEWTREWALKKCKELHYEYLRLRRQSRNFRKIYVR